MKIDVAEEHRKGPPRGFPTVPCSILIYGHVSLPFKKYLLVGAEGFSSFVQMAYKVT